METRVSGFTIVRNAGLLKYPLAESIQSVLPLCDEFIINCGDSTDNTIEICEQLKRQYPMKVKIFFSAWSQRKQKGGFQLKYQTDLAIARCSGEWCFYVQADEVIHENDYHLMTKAIERASAMPEVDGILFQYVHFYGSYDYSIRGRNWYRREVRLFKNNRGITAFRDAQGFRKDGNRLLVIPSDARVFHYGYVRSPSSLRTKSGEMARWWGEKPSDDPESVELRRHVGLTRFEGTHPSVMLERIRANPVHFDPSRCERKWNGREIKNAISLLWEKIFPTRLGEFRNYEIVRLPA